MQVTETGGCDYVHIRTFVLDLITTSSTTNNDVAFLHYFLEILKRSLQNY